MHREYIKKLADRLKSIHLDKEVRIMEVCGTHTNEFFRSGVKDIFPEKLTLVNGPGCPVCVTPNDYLDRAIEIGKKYDPIITTFGDMIKVPSSYSSLGREMTDGMDVRIIYSPMEALNIAQHNPDREIIFLSVGFETTAPTEAVAVIEAKKRNLANFSILPGNKLVPPAVKALLDAEVKIDCFIIPGHVSAIIGEEIWNFIANEYSKPSVIAGFETPDLIISVLSLLDMYLNNKNEVRNEYKRFVKKEGNKKAVECLYEVYEKEDALWRGIGTIPESGLAIKDSYSEFDSSIRFPVTPPPPKEPIGCRCGELLRGIITPPDCPLFGTSCLPESPVGPCMVSSEGPCTAYFKYRSE
ncbi:MAG: hydrogenase formation protein HypD [Spirochaetota bacterium]|nr:hydrogenase formation protein HypD [Spirochaetota bacterium]